MWLPCHRCQTMSFDDWANMNKGLEDANFVELQTLATTSLKAGCCIRLYVICRLLAFGLSASQQHSTLAVWEQFCRTSTRTSQTLSRGFSAWNDWCFLCTINISIHFYSFLFISKNPMRTSLARSTVRPIYDAICAKFVPELCMAVLSVPHSCWKHFLPQFFRGLALIPFSIGKIR